MFISGNRQNFKDAVYTDTIRPCYWSNQNKFWSWIVFLKFILTYYNVIVKVLPRNGQRSGCEQPGPFRFPAQQGSLPQGGDGILTELKKKKNI